MIKVSCGPRQWCRGFPCHGDVPLRLGSALSTFKGSKQPISPQAPSERRTFPSQLPYFLLPCKPLPELLGDMRRQRLNTYSGGPRKGRVPVGLREGCILASLRGGPAYCHRETIPHHRSWSKVSLEQEARWGVRDGSWDPHLLSLGALRHFWAQAWALGFQDEAAQGLEL